MNRIEIKDLEKKFKKGYKKKQSALARFKKIVSREKTLRDIKVLNGISFKAKEGEILGVLGENGSGKSTLLRVLSDVYPEYKGYKNTRGKIVALIGLGQGFVRRLSMKDNIFLVGALLGLSKAELRVKLPEISKFAELEGLEDAKLYQFSEGMRERLAFSLGIHTDPEILLLDEVFAVGDEKFRKKSSDKIKELSASGTTVIFVSHELWMLEEYCDRVIWIKNGIVYKQGVPKKVIKLYKNGKRDKKRV